MLHSEDKIRASILLVDDSQVDLEVLSMVCASLGCEVDTASDFETAESLYREKRHTLVLTDYHMYPKNGIDLTMRILHVNPDACCMIMTAYPDEVIHRFVRGNEVLALITKPIEVASLIETLRVALDRHCGEPSTVDEVAFNNRMDSCLALLGESSVIFQTRKRLYECASSQRPLLLEAEAGVGKACIVHLLHDYGPYGEGQFVELHCDQWDEDALFHQLTDSESGWSDTLKSAENGTLVVYHPYLLSLEHQRILVQHLQRISISTHIIVVGAVCFEEEVAAGRMDEQFYQKLAPETVRIPSLSEHPEDLAAMVHAVATSPVRFALARLFGFEEVEALVEKFELFDFPGNQAELIEHIRRHSDARLTPMQGFAAD